VPDLAIVVYLGDGNDFAQSINDRAVGHTVTFFGEDGDDDLQSDGSADVLDGGPGNDTLTPDDNAPGGGDVVRGGGPGIDSLSGEGSGSGQFTSGFGNDTIDARDASSAARSRSAARSTPSRPAGPRACA
jgi:Ca2+-binding RTX toxin-like protein